MKRLKVCPERALTLAGVNDTLVAASAGAAKNAAENAANKITGKIFIMDAWTQGQTSTGGLTLNV